MMAVAYKYTTMPRQKPLKLPPDFPGNVKAFLNTPAPAQEGEN
jgi:hypothetical protein